MTPSQVFEPLIEDVIASFDLEGRDTIRIVDPFCGDGRLVEALAKRLDSIASEKFNIRVEAALWDADAVILACADKAMAELSKSLAMPFTYVIEKCDAFFDKKAELGSYDICITNPPWASTKSLKKDAFESAEEYKKYQALCNEYGGLLSKHYEEANAKATFGKGTVNLSRYGLALSMRLLNDNGVCAIVMPSSFFADTSSERLRTTIFSKYALGNTRYYSAELKMFSGADQACVSCVLSRTEPETRPKVYSYTQCGSCSFDFSPDVMRYSKDNGFIIPLGYSEEQLSVILKLYESPKLSDLGSVKLGREVDETRISERLCESSNYRFFKGFMIDCYSTSNKPEHVWYYDNSIAEIPDSANKEKVVWRDISRVSQTKRIRATLLPRFCVAGNSLGVATAENPIDLRVFLGVLNSSIFEFLAKTVMTTNHVSAGTLKRIPFPAIKDEEAKTVSHLVDKLLSNPDDEELRLMVDCIVGKAYQLDNSQYKIVSGRDYYCPHGMKE